MIRTTAPKITMPNSINTVKTEKLELKNGLKVYNLNGCTEPVLVLTIMLKAGRYYQAKEMASGFTIALLKRGTKTMSANEIAEKLDFAGASLSVESGMFMVSISLSCLTAKLEEVLPILHDILTESNFPQSEIDIEKKKQIQNLKINEEKNNFIASLKFNAAICGKNHPCGYAPTENFIKDLERNDIVSYYKNTFQLNNESYIVMAGDIDEHIISLVDNYIGVIKLSTFKDNYLAFSPAKEKNITINKKDSIQSSIRIGMNLIDSNHSDFLDFEIVNRILGGYFGSRLMTNIREDKGYTYGIYSYVSAHLNGSYFVIATEVGSQYKDETLNEISLEINRLKTELISDDELLMVKNYHKGRIMKTADGALRFSNIVNKNISLGLKEDIMNKRLKAVEEISAERILELANKYLDFEKMYKIIVG